MVQSVAQFDALEALRLELLADFESYVRAMYKAQYKRNFVVSSHHKKLFAALIRVVDGDCKRLIINMPPRYSKTEVVVKMFISWCYALNAACKFLHLSYSDMLIKDNSDTVRQIMMLPLYNQLFPTSALEKQKSSSSRWKTAAGGEMYAVSTQGQVTGFGAGKVDDDEAGDLDESWVNADSEFLQRLGLINANSNIFEGALIIDDPLKPEDAQSETVRERINTRFESTIRNRVNSRNTPIIIIMQRLHEHDLCGYLMEIEPEEWEVLSLPAIQTDEETGEESALWPMKHTLEELYKMRQVNPLIFDTQYMQDPKPKEGLMYSMGFRTYQTIPFDPKNKNCNYTDTADTGSDSLCSICFVETPEALYVTDVLFTNKPMEFTEPETAKMLQMNRTQFARIESNNGGRGFARAVEKILRRSYKNHRISINWFTQTLNKFERIFNASAEVQNMILFPEDWMHRWPQFYSAITSYRKDNKRKTTHDDAPDALTGVYEMHCKAGKKKKMKQLN